MDYEYDWRFFYYGKYASGGWCKIIYRAFTTKKDALEYAKRYPFSGDWKIEKSLELIGVKK